MIILGYSWEVGLFSFLIVKLIDVCSSSDSHKLHSLSRFEENYRILTLRLLIFVVIFSIVIEGVFNEGLDEVSQVLLTLISHDGVGFITAFTEVRCLYFALAETDCLI